MVEVRVQWELNMLTIQLDEQMSHSWPGRHALLFFLLERSDRHPSLRDLALAQGMS